MCSGSIDPVYVLKALLDGADGVLIGGCHLGECHYQNGNYKAMRRCSRATQFFRALIHLHHTSPYHRLNVALVK